MNQYDQLVEFESIALSIFHNIKTYVPAKELLKYLQENHPDYLDRLSPNQAIHSDGDSRCSCPHYYHSGRCEFFSKSGQCEHPRR